MLSASVNQTKVNTMSDAVCHKCNETISQRIVTALGKSWHPEHFACRECDTPIVESTFNIHEGEPVCTECFIKKYSGTCFACKQPITERTIKALGHTWHEECFVCNGPCKKSLVGTSFYERDGNAYCKSDYEQLFAAKCNACSKPITDNAIIALNVKWHRDCFKCQKCDKPISASTFAVEDNKPICTECAA